MATDQKQNGETAHLRELFTDITGQSSVTEEQRQTHGTVRTEKEVTDTIQAIIDEIRDRYSIDTTLDDDDLIDIVRGFHQGLSDRAIARTLGNVNLDRAVARARLQLHLFRDVDFEAPFDIDRLEELWANGQSTSDIANKLEVSPSTVRFYRTAVAAREDAQRVNHQFQMRFAELFDGHNFSEHLVSSLRHEGITDAML